MEQVPISVLTPDPRNARTHTKQQISQIAESIREFGFVNPVLIDEANLVIAGHGRLAAARLLSLETVPANHASIAHFRPVSLTLTIRDETDLKR